MGIRNIVGYEHDITLERRHAKTLKAILGNQFICQDPILDQEQGTDFLIMTVHPFRVGVRLRRHQYYENPLFRLQFTIRWTRPSGVKTEIHKIREGLVDYILYGFVSQDEKRIIQYFIGDLRIFKTTEPSPVAIYPNKPFDSELAVYNLADLPRQFVVKTWRKTSTAST